MSFGIRQREAKFTILRKDYLAACKALKQYFADKGTAEYVEASNVIRACQNGDLAKAMFYCRWKCEEDESGIVDIEFIQSNLGSDYELFCAISKCVQDGSYIVVEGEDKNIFRWRFKDGACIEENGYFRYESDPLYSVVCDWISDCESGVSVLCVTPDIAEARRCLKENIEIEKTNSWIGDVDDADVGNTDEHRYCEELEEDCWSFYKNGSYLEAHTTIKIFEYEKEN